LAAYLMLAERLLVSPDGFDESWNIGPAAGDSRAVLDVATDMIAALGAGRIVTDATTGHPHEANLLALDCAKVRSKLGWKPGLSLEQAIVYTVEWYKAWHSGLDMAAFTRRQIKAFETLEHSRSQDLGTGKPTP
jgi:CDP-glucose 4,6-dehydratase